MIKGLSFGTSSAGYGLTIRGNGGEDEAFLIASAGQGGKTRYTFAVVGVDMTMNCLPGKSHPIHAEQYPPPVTGEVLTGEFEDVAVGLILKWAGTSEEIDAIRDFVTDWLSPCESSLPEYINAEIIAALIDAADSIDPDEDGDVPAANKLRDIAKYLKTKPD